MDHNWNYESVLWSKGTTEDKCHIRLVFTIYSFQIPMVHRRLLATTFILKSTIRDMHHATVRDQTVGIRTP